MKRICNVLLAIFLGSPEIYSQELKKQELKEVGVLPETQVVALTYGNVLLVKSENFIAYISLTEKPSVIKKENLKIERAKLQLIFLLGGSIYSKNFKSEIKFEMIEQKDLSILQKIKRGSPKIKIGESVARWSYKDENSIYIYLKRGLLYGIVKKEE